MEPSGVGDHQRAKVVGKSGPARDFAVALTHQVHANTSEEHMAARMKSLCESNNERLPEHHSALGHREPDNWVLDRALLENRKLWGQPILQFC